jgi:hypothetical protein
VNQHVVLNAYADAYSGYCETSHSFFPKSGHSYRITIDNKDNRKCNSRLLQVSEDGTTHDVTPTLEKNWLSCGELKNYREKDTYRLANLKYRSCSKLAEWANSYRRNGDIDGHSRARACKTIMSAETLEGVKLAAQQAFLGFSVLGSSDEINVFHLRNGGAESIRRAAKSMYENGEANTQVLDVAAEVLLDRYVTTDENTVDALAWVMKALGNSGSGRYYDVLSEVSKTKNYRKLRGYAEAAIESIGASEGVQYQRGMFDLNAELVSPVKLQK